MFQYSICDMHFWIMKYKLILGISCIIFKVFSDKLFFLNSARHQIPLFANKKKELVRIELTFSQEVLIIVRVNEYEAVSVNFLSVFAPHPFLAGEVTHVYHSFNDFNVYGNLTDVDFALSCMDVKSNLN